ncbi:MAG: Gx transporter family protein [Eubacteriales bacterium]
MKTKKITFLGLFVALAMILSFVETLLPPITTAFPGIKMGLPNIAIMFVLYRIGAKEAAIVSLVRVLLVSILFGNVQSMLYSLCGAVLSLTAMILMQKFSSFSHVSVSVVGGVFHNIGQILMAALITDTQQIVYYLPVLLISGTAAGLLVGLTAGFLEKRVQDIKF